MIRSMKFFVRVVTTVCTVLWMVLIFSFSAQPDTESAQVSSGVSYRLVSGIDQILKLEKSEQEIKEAAVSIEFPVRKIAHMSEFAILFLLLLGMFFAYGKTKHAFKYAFWLTVLYAATDEFHQLFVPGRAGRIMDVLIDSAGAFFALLAAGLIIKKFNGANHI